MDNTKVLLIAVLNKALARFKGGDVCKNDIVTDYNSENVSIASYIERHPGWIKIYVTLKQGSGCFFVKGETTILGNVYYIAWEEDDKSYPVLSLYNSVKDNLTDLVNIDVITKELSKIITTALFKY